MMIADASVWINVVASGAAERILDALGESVAITDVAFAELDRGRPKGRQAADEVTALVHVGLAEIVALTPEDEALFIALVSGPAAETLDDGEAATLACADRLRACPVIDERKASRLAARRLSHLQLRSTLDIFLAQTVRDVFDDEALGDALYRALSGARMRVPEHHAEEVIRLVGHQRAANCSSLPATMRGDRAVG